MAQTCPQCGGAAPVGARFCGSCGGPLQSRAAPAAALPGERRPVTALFADIVGSTQLVADSDPEDWANAINWILQLMSEVVARYEGTVAQLAGDGLLALFGAPAAHEDDPERAVRAGLDMVTALATAGDDLLPDNEAVLRIRVGVSTGPVVVATVGGQLRSEYTALGDAVNMAARMQAAARPGTVVVTSDTYRHVAPTVEAHDLGPIPVKGKDEPVQAYEVVGLRPHVAVVRGPVAAPLVGRAPELALLEEALSAVLAGRGRTALVLGEAGIGKSRLVRELQLRELGGGGMRWAQGRCLSFGGSFAYHLVVDLVRSLVRIPAGEHDAEARRLLDEAFGDLGAGGTEAADLAHLIGLPLASSDRGRLEALEPAAIQARYLEAMRRLLVAVSARGPLVLVCEDLHWADASSVDLLVRLVPVVEEAPLLLVLTGRAERDAPGWRLISEVRTRFGEALIELPLGPLQPQAARELVDTLAHRQPAAEPLSYLVAAKAEGNPLFIEELVRALLERDDQDAGVAAHGLTLEEIPDSLHGLLLARIDRLPESARRLLRIAAVIGREFPAALLGEVVAALGEGVAAGRQLSALEAAGLLVVASVRPELVYSFRHALIAEAAYGSLLRQERRRLHGLAGEAIERLYGDRRGELADQLAHHFELAKQEDRAASYQLEAGERALRRFANREALESLEKAAAYAAVAGDTAQGARFRLATLLSLGEARRVNGDILGAKSTLEQAAGLARDIEDDQAFARAALGYGRASDIWGVDMTLQRLLGEALDRLRVDTSPLRARIRARLAQALFYDADADRRRALIDAAVQEARDHDDDLALAEVLTARHALSGPDDLDERLQDATLVAEIGQRIGDRDLEIRGRGWRLVDLLERADAEAAFDEIERHAELARRLGDPLHLRDATAWRAMRAAVAGRFSEAQTLQDEAYRIGHEAGDHAAALIRLNQRWTTLCLRGGPDDFDALMVDTLNMIASESHMTRLWKLWLAFVDARLGFRDAAAASLEEAALGDFGQIPRNVVWVDLLACAAEVSAFIGDIPRARQLYDLLRPYARRLAVSDRAFDPIGSVARSLGLLATLLGRFDDAEAHFETALDHHDRLGSPPLVVLTQAGYVQMLRARRRPGDDARADDLSRRMLAVAHQLDIELPDDEHWPVDLRTRPTRAGGATGSG